MINNAEKVVNLKLPDAANTRTNSKWPTKIYFNDTGYIDDDLFEKVANEFTHIWKLRYPGLICVPLGDNLGSHRNIDIIVNGQKDNIHWWFFVENTTHWIQPLDSYIFARFKQVFHQRLQERLYGMSLLQNFSNFSLIYEIEEAQKVAYTKETIEKSFSVTGIFPFSKKIIKSSLKQNHPQENMSDDSATEDESGIDQIVKKTVSGVEKVWKNIVEEQKQVSKKIVNVKTIASKLKAYDPKNIIEEHQKKRLEEQESLKKKEELKRKREQEAYERREAKKIRKEAFQEKQREWAEKKKIKIHQKEQRRLSNTCRECNKKCLSGPGWVGCEVCEVFWVCPKCYSRPKIKKMLTLHEKTCK